MNLKSFENSLIGGVHTFICKKPCSIMMEYTLNVILGFIPRIHANQSLNRHPRAWLLARSEDLDSRVKPENDHNTLRLQCAPDTTGFLSDVCKRSTRAQKFLADGVQCGRSMIEMLGVLAIIGILSVGGIAGYSKAMMKFKINKTAQQITEIVTNIRTLYMHQDDYNGLNTITAIQIGAVPDDLDIDTSRGKWSAVKNTFGGTIDIWGNLYDQNKSFYVRLSGLPEEACVALATIDWGTTSSSGFVGMDVIAYSSGMGFIFDGCDGEGEFGSDNHYYYACSGHLPLSPVIAAKYCHNWSSGRYIGFAFK